MGGMGCCMVHVTLLEVELSSGILRRFPLCWHLLPQAAVWP